MNKVTRIHNNPPDPIDEALAPFSDAIDEAQNWLDGAVVETEGQMKAVDALIKSIKGAKKAVEAAEESAAKPIYDQWKAEKARFKPTIDDLDMQVKGLVSAVDAFKRKLATEKAEAERKARDEAEKARRLAEEAARTAAATDIEAQRAAAQAQKDADDAQRAFTAASKDTVKGLRTYTWREITDGTALARWLWINDKPALLSFMEGYVSKLSIIPSDMPGVVEKSERRAV